MNDASDDALHPDRPATAPWRPSDGLRSELLSGVWAVVAATGLTATSMVLTLKDDQAKGFTIAVALSLASIVPQFWVLRAFLGLARDTKSDSLKRTSIGIYGAICLFQGVALADESILPEACLSWLLGALGVALLALVIYCFLPAFKAAPIILLACAISFRRLFKFVPQWLPFLQNVDALGRLLFIVAGYALLALVILVVWFNVTLIRLRDRLGGMAALAGWGYLLSLVGALVLSGWFFNEVYVAANQPAALELEFEDLVRPQIQVVEIACLGGELFTAALTVLLFLGVRGRGQSATDDGTAS